MNIEIRYDYKRILLFIGLILAGCHSRDADSRSDNSANQTKTEVRSSSDRDSCQNLKPGFRLRKFYLQDSIFSFALQVPNDMDTFYTWVDSSDATCTTRRTYRFASAAYPIFEESGFLPAPQPDSIYSVTLSHKVNFDCKESKATSMDRLLELYKQKANSNGAYFEVQGIEHANNNGVAATIATVRTNFNNSKKNSSSILWVLFNHQSIGLEMKCECSGVNCKKFVFVMNETLKTVQIQKRDHL